MGVQACARAIVALVGLWLTEVARVEVCATIHVVADQVAIHVGCAIATADANRIQFVAFAVTSTWRNACAPTSKHRSWTVAFATNIQHAHADIHVVADAILVFVFVTIAATNAECVLLVAIAVAIPCWDAIASTHAAFVELVAIAITIPCGDAIAAANPTFVQLVAIAVAIPRWNAIASTHATCIKLVAIAVAIPCGNAVATAHTTLVQRQARTIVGVGIVVEIAGRCVGAAQNLGFARTVVVVRLRVKVGRRRIGATACIGRRGACTVDAGTIERKRFNDVFSSLSTRQHLDIQQAIHGTCGGHLKDEHTQVFVRQRVARVAQRKPRTANQTIAQEARGTIGGEEWNNGLRLVFHNQCIGGIRDSRGRSRTVQANGRVSVIHHFRENGKEVGVETRGIPRGIQWTVVRPLRDVDHEGCLRIAKHRAHVVVGVLNLDIEPVRCHAFKRSGRIRIHFKGIPLDGCTTAKLACFRIVDERIFVKVAGTFVHAPYTAVVLAGAIVRECTWVKIACSWVGAP